MRNKKLLFIISILCCAILFCGLYIQNQINFPNDFYVNYDEIEEINNDILGKIISLSLKEDNIKTGQEKASEGEVVFKLFGFLPIKKVRVKILPEDEVYVGGSTIGLSIQTDGAVVVSDTTIDLENNNINKNETFKNGDIIQEINGEKISSLQDIDKALEKIENGKTNITYLRNNKERQSEVSLIKNADGKYKLGLWVRDDIMGIGTLTFVKKDSGQFAALGHAITNGVDENIIPITEGGIYDCSLINIEKGEKNKPGELKCVFAQRDKLGKVQKNTKVGIYGILDNFENLVDTNRTAKLGGRLSVKPGKAKIVSTVSGIADEYEIEIIKTRFQSNCDDKSLVIRVTDKRLLNLTGGIVQGMSGSPIIQNDKVVGAVTHVFLKDPTKGYGVYTDWMLEQLG